MLRLQDGFNGAEIGTLRLHNDEQMDRWPRPGDFEDDNTEPSTRRIEVVAINRRVEFSHRKKKGSEKEAPCLTRDEYVTVLWVEWEGVVAYRRACGKIKRKAWEGLNLEEIDLVLG